jgi:uncharacterized protein
MRRQLLGLVLCMVASGAARAATPDGAVSDCARPASRAEATICADPMLLDADRGLAELAGQLRQRLQDKAGAVAAQLDWVRRRDRMCGPGMAADCLRIAYEERQAWLRARLLTAPPVAAAPPPALAPARPPVPDRPALAPVAQALPFALRLAAAPCAMVRSESLRAAGWSAGEAPFGQPREAWSKPDFAALIQRSAECQAENGDNPRNVQAMAAVLNQMRAMAPDRLPGAPAAASPGLPPLPQPAAPQPVPPQAAVAQAVPPPASRPDVPPRASFPAPAPPPDSAEQPPLSLNCADAALLQDVSFTYQSTPQLSDGARIQRLSNPRPYADVIMEAYSGTPALRAEYQRLRPYMAPVPQCLVDAETTQGPVVLSYRLYLDAGRPLIEVQRVP